MKTKILLFLSMCFFGTITAQTYVAGDYKTTAATNMSTGTGWQRYNGTIWESVANQPLGSFKQYGTAASGSTTITLSAPNYALRAGQIISSGTLIPSGTVVTSVSGTTMTISQATTAAVATTLNFYETGTYSAITNGTTTLTLALANTAIVPGMYVSGTGIPAGTTVSSVTNSTTVVLSAAATNSATNNINFATTPTTALAYASGASTITLAAENSLLKVGMSVSGTGIYLGTTITSISGATIGLSVPTYSASGATGLIFGYVVIPNMYINHDVTSLGNNRGSTIGNLIIDNSAKFLIEDASTYASELTFGTITIAPGATFANKTSANTRVSVLTINGGKDGACITNNGTLDLTTTTGTTSTTKTTIYTQGNTTITGTGATTKFNEFTVQLGAINNTLDITTTNSFSMLAGGAATALKILGGTLKLSAPCDIAPFGATAQAIANVAGLYLNHASANVTCGFTDGTGLTVSGKLIIANGKLTVNGRYNANTTGTTTISGGTLEIPAGLTYANNSGALFHVAATHVFNMTGGNINIKSRNSGTYTNPDFFISTTNLSMTGGTVTFSDAAAIKSSCSKFYNLVVASGAGSGTTLSLQNASTTVLNQLTVNSGNTLDKGSNNTIINYSITGDITNGSATVALQSNYNVAVGQYVGGAGIVPNTTVTAVSQTLATTGTTTSASKSVTNVMDVTNVTTGMMIFGTGIAPGTTITAIAGSSAPYTLTLSADATASNAGIALIINPTITLSNAAITTTAATPLLFSLVAEGTTAINNVDSELNAPIVAVVNSTLKISKLAARSAVRVYDAQGRLISNKMATENVEIYLKSKGIYVVKIDAGSKSLTKKIAL